MKIRRWITRNNVKRLAIRRVPVRVLDFESLRVIYCPMAKNGSTYFKKALMERSEFYPEFLESGGSLHEFAFRHPRLRMRDFSRLDDSGSLSFAIVRDPIDRAVSAYLNKFVSITGNLRVARQATAAYVELVNSDFDPERLLNFRQFVRLICHQADSELDHHWRPQHTFLRDYTEKFDWLVPQHRIADFLPILESHLGDSMPRERSRNRVQYSREVPEGVDYTRWAPQRLRHQKLYPTRDVLVSPDLLEALQARFALDLDLFSHAQESFEQKLLATTSS